MFLLKKSIYYSNVKLVLKFFRVHKNTSRQINSSSARRADSEYIYIYIYPPGLVGKYGTSASKFLLEQSCSSFEKSAFPSRYLLKHI